MFVHGNPDTGSDWMPLMARIAGFANVVAPDLPGFGAADPVRTAITRSSATRASWMG